MHCIHWCCDGVVPTASHSRCVYSVTSIHEGYFQMRGITIIAEEDKITSRYPTIHAILSLAHPPSSYSSATPPHK